MVIEKEMVYWIVSVPVWKGCPMRAVYISFPQNRFTQNVVALHANRNVVDNHLINITGKLEPTSNSIFREISE